MSVASNIHRKSRMSKDRDYHSSKPYRIVHDGPYVLRFSRLSHLRAYTIHPAANKKPYSVHVARVSNTPRSFKDLNTHGPRLCVIQRCACLKRGLASSLLQLQRRLFTHWKRCLPFLGLWPRQFFSHAFFSGCCSP